MQPEAAGHEIKCCTVLGLASAYANLDAFIGDIITLNDWYIPSCYGKSPPFPRFNPKYIFQIHDETIVNDPEFYERSKKMGRWLGDWKEMYNEYAETAVTTFKIPGLKNQEIFDVDKAVRQFGSWALTSSINYMLVWAFWKGYRFIRLNACPQTNEDYAYQMPGSYLLIAHLRSLGCFIDNPYEFGWSQMLQGYEWAKFVDVDYIYGGKKPLEKVKVLYDFVNQRKEILAKMTEDAKKAEQEQDKKNELLQK